MHTVFTCTGTAARPKDEQSQRASRPRAPNSAPARAVLWCGWNSEAANCSSGSWCALLLYPPPNMPGIAPTYVARARQLGQTMSRGTGHTSVVRTVRGGTSLLAHNDRQLWHNRGELGA